MSQLRISKNFFLIELRSWIEYPFNFLVSIVWVFVGIIPMYFLWKLIFANNLTTGYTLTTIVLYMFFTYGLSYGGNIAYPVRREILSGDITRILVRNISLQRYFINRIYARALNKIIVAFPLILMVGLVYSGWHSLLGLGLYLVGAFLASLMYASLVTSSFWFGDNWGVFYSFELIVSILSGAILPLDLYPHYMQVVINYLPFKLLFYLPAKVYIGEYLPTIWDIGLYVIWAIVLYLLLTILIKKGNKKYEQLGG